MRFGGVLGSLARVDVARNVARSAIWSEAKTKLYLFSVNGLVCVKKCEYVLIVVLIDLCVFVGVCVDVFFDDVSYYDDKIVVVVAYAYRAATSKSAVVGIVLR